MNAIKKRYLLCYLLRTWNDEEGKKFVYDDEAKVMAIKIKTSSQMTEVDMSKKACQTNDNDHK